MNRFVNTQYIESYDVDDRLFVRNIEQQTCSALVLAFGNFVPPFADAEEGIQCSIPPRRAWIDSATNSHEQAVYDEPEHTPGFSVLVWAQSPAPSLLNQIRRDEIVLVRAPQISSCWIGALRLSG